MIGNLKFERLGNYEVKGVVAQRRHGVLFEGYDPTHDRPVLLNVWTDMALDGDLRERFEQHIHKLMEFQHPNILGILDLGVDLEQHLAWWVMPFVSGAFLEERLGTRWAVSEAVRVAAEVAQALDYASQKGVLHQALYPENILLTERGWSLVMDFGMVAFLEEEPEAAMIVYWAPERLQGTAGQLTSDLYAVGVILYEMLAGQLPFAADNVGALAERQLQGPRPLRKIRSDVPREVDAIVLQLLAGDPHLRFSDGAVLARSLVEALPPMAPDHHALLHLLQVLVESPISFRSLLSALSLWLQLHFGLNSALFCGAQPVGF